jgi:voltage-gated sodium channel
MFGQLAISNRVVENDREQRRAEQSERLEQVRCEREKAGLRPLEGESQPRPPDAELLFMARPGSDGPDEQIDPQYLTGCVSRSAALTGVVLWCHRTSLLPKFNLLMLGLILLAGINVGLQTYDSLANMAALDVVDNIVLAMFALEIMIKVGAKGSKPHHFFTKADGAWNTFDLFLVIMSLPIFNWGNSIGLLRMVRLMRLFKLIKKVPQLYTIVRGLIGGLRSIGYVLLLMFLIFYIYAIIGFYLFTPNDTWHFGSIWLGLLTLWQVCTFESWASIMYVNYYGCNSPYYELPGIYSAREDDAAASGLFYCPLSMSSAQGWIAVLYFVSFIFISAFVMLSLFVGSITMSMSEAMAALKAEKEEAYRQKVLERARQKALKERISHRTVSMTPTPSRQVTPAPSRNALTPAPSRNPIGLTVVRPMGVAQQLTGGLLSKVQKQEQAQAQAQAQAPQQRMQAAQPPGPAGPAPVHEEQAEEDDEGLDMGGTERAKFRWLFAKALGEDAGAFSSDDDNPTAGYGLLKLKWVAASDVALVVAGSRLFSVFTTFVIVVAAAMVGVNTFQMSLENEELATMMDLSINGVFMAEILLKTVSLRFEPWQFFWARGKLLWWNAFDFFIVLATLMPGGGSMIGILRLLRLLRLLKLNKALSGLQVIIISLIKGLNSITYIGAILFLTYYIFALIAMSMFKENDPFHWGSLHISLLTLFRLATMDDWANVMYINMFGCDKPGYGIYNIEDQCVRPHAYGFVAGIFHFVFSLIGGLVMTTLFIGVVSTSMDEAYRELQERKQKEEDVLVAKEELGLSDDIIAATRGIFETIDLDQGGTIDEEELAIGFLTVGGEFNKDEIKAMVAEVDKDNSGEIDISEFVRFMAVFKRKTAERAKAKREAKERRRQARREAMSARQVMEAGAAAAAAAAAAARRAESPASTPDSPAGASAAHSNKRLPLLRRGTGSLASLFTGTDPPPSPSHAAQQGHSPAAAPAPAKSDGVRPALLRRTSTLGSVFSPAKVAPDIGTGAPPSPALSHQGHSPAAAPAAASPSHHAAPAQAEGVKPAFLVRRSIALRTAPSAAVPPSPSTPAQSLAPGATAAAAAAADTAEAAAAAAAAAQAAVSLSQQQHPAKDEPRTEPQAQQEGARITATLEPSPEPDDGLEHLILPH